MGKLEKFELKGKVHTVQVAILDTDAELVGRRIDNDNRVTKDIGSGRINGEQVRYLKYNPNRWWDCRTLGDFEMSVVDWAQREGIPVDRLRYVRVDFAVDCMIGSSEENVDCFRKLCDALILEFNTKHKTKDKDQYYGSTQTTMRHKNNKAKWGAFEFECYDKRIQKEREGVSCRLEMRCIQDKRRKRDKPMTSIKPMLEAIRKELRSLPAYYEQAQELMNENLMRKYHEERAAFGEKIGLNSFIFMNRDRVFSRQQLRGLFELAGKNDPDEAVRRYCKRHKQHKMIEKSDMIAFVEMLDGMIEKWVKSDPFFVDFFEGRKTAKPY